MNCFLPLFKDYLHICTPFHKVVVHVKEGKFLTRALRCELDLFEVGHTICEAESMWERICLEGYMKVGLDHHV